MARSTKIVATIGPASQDEETIHNLLHAGVDIFRLNFSHGTHEMHEIVYQRLRQGSKRHGKSVTIFQDLQGPKIRTGEIENGQVEIFRDQVLVLTIKPTLGNQQLVSVDFPHLTRSVQPGSRILLDDGNLELLVTEVSQELVHTRVVLAGVLKSHKGVNLPGARLDIPGFTPKDEADLQFGLKLGVDAVAVSFVRTASDVVRVRQAVQKYAPERKNIPIIAKLERPEAMQNLDAIIAEADGVMVARGDLGVEMAPEAVPIAQKRIIDAANRRGRVVITATQMLDSMINNPRPTRAEASDVANAIFDGTDAVMLSGETAAGRFPVQAVRMMAAIIEQAEKQLGTWGHWKGQIDPLSNCDDTFFISQAARELAHDKNVSAIAAFTQTGHTALLLSKTRPNVPILAFTPDEYTFQRCNLYWGVSTFLVPYVNTIDDMIQAVENAILESNVMQHGQQVVLTCGYPILQQEATNLALLHTIRRLD